MSVHCKCVNFSPHPDFPIDAPCPPLSLSYSRFYEHALSQKLECADILKIAEQCNLKAIEIITQVDTNLPWWIILLVVVFTVIILVTVCVCWRRKTKQTKKQANLACIKLTCASTKELNAAKTDSRIKGINL